MTCIVGIKTEQGVWMGGDSAVSHQYELRHTAVPKVFIKDNLLIGGAGQPRAFFHLQHQWTVPERFGELTLYGWLATTVANSIRALYEANGIKPSSGDWPNPLDTMIGCEGRLFYLDSQFGLHEHADDFEAMGAGSEYAIGALAALGDYMAPPDRIKRALAIAARFSPSVRSPFEILYLAKESEAVTYGDPERDSA